MWLHQPCLGFPALKKRGSDFPHIPCLTRPALQHNDVNILKTPLNYTRKNGYMVADNDVGALSPTWRT